MRFDGKKTKRLIKSWTLNELSSVKSGAQVPAKATIMKISSDNLREILQDALRSKYPKPDDGNFYNLWVCDFDEQYVVFEGYDNVQHATPYALVDGNVVLGDDTVRVVRQGYYASESGEQFFKTATDAYCVSLLSAVGFNDDQSVSIVKSIDTSGSVIDQVATLSAQFGKAITASVGGEQHPASDFAYVPDPEKPSTWKLPIFDADTTEKAVALLNGKKISISDDERGKVLTAVRAAYREYHPDKELPDVLKKSGDADMSDNKTPEQLQKELDAATARNAELETLAKMSDTEKTYMSKMSDEDKKKFMELTTEEREKQMKTAKAADETFTMADGQVIAKSDVGEAAFGFMKQQNDEFVKMRDREANREALELVKSICPNLPGVESEMAGALRKCRDNLTTGEFEVLEKALKAGDEALKNRMVAKAHDAPVGNDDAKVAYDAGIQKLMTDKGISKSAAMSSPEGLKLAKAFNEATKETD